MSKSTPTRSTTEVNAPTPHWLLIVSFFLVYLVGLVWLALNPAVWRFAQPYAEFTIQHPSFVRLSTCILCAGCAWFMFWPRGGGRFIGRWSDYVGMAFAMFALQYGVRFVELKLEGTLGHVGPIHHTATFLVYVTSALNNLFFFAAARVLLRKNKIAKRRELNEDGRVLTQPKDKLLNALEEFRVSVPVWAFVWALLAPVGLLDVFADFKWVRFVDAVFSIYCLLWFGYAIAVNLNWQRGQIWGAAALFIALLYGGGQWLYAMVPMIAPTASANHVSFVDEWLRTTTGTTITELKDKTNIETGRQDDERAFLDNVLYAMMLPMKLALFLPAFSLYLIFFIDSLTGMIETLYASINRRQDYLSKDGIVEAIATALGAEKVALYIRIPGLHELPTGREERALPLVWHHRNGHLKTRRTEPLSIEQHDELTKIMKEEGREILRSENRSDSLRSDRFDKSSWWVPIRFHGGVIGVLEALLPGGRNNHTTLQKFRLMSDVIAPSVQDYRSLAAMDQMGFRFTRLQVDYPKEIFEDSTKRMAHVLYDVLSPLASGLIIEFGFTSIPHYEASIDTHEQFLKDHRPDVWPEDEEILTIGDLMLAKSTMMVRTRETDENGENKLVVQRIGGLMLAIPAAKDEPSRPTLAAYYLNRKAVASLAADGVLDLARDSLGKIIKDLGVEFSKEQLSESTWFAALQAAITRSGIQWAIARPAENEEHPEGHLPIELDPCMTDEQRQALFVEPLATPGLARLPTKHTIRLVLPKSKYRLWLGIKRTGFGPELNFDSPWRVFLSDLANVCDAALDSLKTQQAVESALQNENVITIALTAGNIMHQVLNLMNEQLVTAQILEEETRKQDIQLNERCESLIETLLNTTEHGRELADAFAAVTRLEGPWPCLLKEATEEAHKLYKLSLKDRNIGFTNDESTEIEIDVPFFVSAFSLANLIGNARDAIWGDGWIKIAAESKDEYVECHVTNSGPEIPPYIKKTLFQFGQSFKDGHNGWGLYFVKRTLKAHGGDIWLAYSNFDDGTRFTIRFPKKHPTRNSPII